MPPFESFSNTINGNAVTNPVVSHGINPSTQEPLWDVPVASENDLEAAVSAASTAFLEWSKTTWVERRWLLLESRNILLQHKSEMASLLTKEVGKPIEFASMEVEYAAGYLEFNAMQDPIETRVIQDDDQIHLSLSYKPLGVVGAISPWNFPLVLSIAKVAAALITGNCIIVKPSPFTPYSILKFVELVRQLFPPGVLQALNGDDALGPAICSHPSIQKISFTGSIATGKKVAAAAAQSLKAVTLELGGNNACIVCDDVDIQEVAPQIAIGAFTNSGQFCLASKRIYVHRDIYDAFLKTMVDFVKTWVVAPTSDLTTGINIGPIQNRMQHKIVKSFVNDSIQKGHRFALGYPSDNLKGDLLINPAIIDNPPDDSLVVTGEAFGPIVPLLKWSSEDDVIKRVNNTPTGLGGSVWSKDVERARRIADQIEAGSVWINSSEKPLPQAHLAGYKESGLGGEWGCEGLLSYCKPQVVHYYKSPRSKI